MRKVCPSCKGKCHHLTNGPSGFEWCSLCDGQGYVRGDLDLRKIEPWTPGERFEPWTPGERFVPWTPGERFVPHAAAIIAICLLVMIWVTS